MIIFGYIILLILSYVVEFGITFKMITDFYNELFDEGYKINSDYYNKISKKYKPKANILDFVPGLFNIQHYFKIKRNFKKIRKDPAFINNLVELSIFDKAMMATYYENNGKLSVIENIKRGLIVIGLCKDVNVRYDGDDLGTITDEELKMCDGFLSDEIIDKINKTEEVKKKNEGKASEQSFYTLSGEYNMSDVFRIDENAIFIKTPENSYVAIVNATNEEANAFLSKSLIVKPKLGINYHIISIKPFDKNIVRRALVEMEYFKSSNNVVIDGDTLRPEGEEKKRTL